jgi:hypothetical protein
MELSNFQNINQKNNQDIFNPGYQNKNQYKNNINSQKRVIETIPINDRIDDVNKIKKEINADVSEIYFLKNKIKLLESRVIKKREIMKKMCPHEITIDRSYRNEKPEYICNICDCYLSILDIKKNG